MNPQQQKFVMCVTVKCAGKPIGKKDPTFLIVNYNAPRGKVEQAVELFILVFETLGTTVLRNIGCGFGRMGGGT